MMFDLADSWVWDSWLADDGDLFHLFFLHAPRRLGDPDRRHDHARIGHATSPDLRRWERVEDPLPEPRAGFDDLAQWTGCVVPDPPGWRMFTTGRSHVDAGGVQRIGSARSTDLRAWEREDGLLEADPRWYDLGADTVHWRDPWLVADASGRWHLYATARAGGPGSGIVAHAVSDDLERWEVRPPLSRPSGRFDWLEVIQVVPVEGRWVLLFSCMSHEMPGSRPGAGGIWTVPVRGPGDPVDVASAVRLTDESRYAGRVVQDRQGRWQLIAFRNQGPGGSFLGGTADPVPVDWRQDGRGLQIVAGGDRPEPLA